MKLFLLTTAIGLFSTTLAAQANLITTCFSSGPNTSRTLTVNATPSNFMGKNFLNVMISGSINSGETSYAIYGYQSAVLAETEGALGSSYTTLLGGDGALGENYIYKMPVMFETSITPLPYYLERITLRVNHHSGAISAKLFLEASQGEHPPTQFEETFSSCSTINEAVLVPIFQPIQ